MTDNHTAEILNGERFELGANWSRLLGVLNNECIARAEQSLCEKNGVDNLSCKQFLDAGRGFGLFGLAAQHI